MIMCMHACMCVCMCVCMYEGVGGRKPKRKRQKGRDMKVCFLVFESTDEVGHRNLDVNSTAMHYVPSEIVAVTLCFVYNGMVPSISHVLG